MKIIVGTMTTQVDFQGNTLLQEKVHGAVHRTVEHGGMGVKNDGAIFSRAYKAGVWDGITDFYDFKEDTFHTGLLQQFLGCVRTLQEKDTSITYEIEDTRPSPIMSAEAIDPEIVLGNGDEEPIILRDYQYESVKRILEEQIGIVNLATNAGKSLFAAGLAQQILPRLKRGERIIFCTHSKEILRQTSEGFSKALEIPMNKIGIVGNGKFDIKNKQLVFVMIPTLVSALKDPKKGVKFSAKERVIKMIAEDIAPKFVNTTNTRTLLQNYIKNCRLTTNVWKDAEEQLMYIAYDKKFNDRSAKLQLKKYITEFEKIMEKKNKSKYKKYKDTMSFLESVRVVIMDEVHHAKSDTWFSSISLCTNAIYRVGLTGTVDKKDKMGWQRLQALLGGIVTKVSNDYLIKKGISSKPIIRLMPVIEPKSIELVNNYMEAYKKGIVENDYRNDIITQLAESYQKRRPGGILISVKDIEHGDRILEKLREHEMEAEFIHGGSDPDHRVKQLERFSKGELGILIGSTIIDEGIDMKSIGCMILAAGGKSMRQQLQRIGRGLRLNGIDGNSVMVFDFMDMTNKYLKQHSLERLKLFKAEGFDVKILQ